MPVSVVTTLRLATRGSTLALAQAGEAARALYTSGSVETTLVLVRTTGDRQADVPLDRLPGQGWFTGELEASLIDGRADVAVHSAKDLPTTLADRLAVVALLPRGDPRDGLVTRARCRLSQLPDGATVGSSSTRRVAFLNALRPGLRAVPIRGNVDTRLGKLYAGEVDALIVACAGMDRLGLGDRVDERLDPSQFVPAPGQGAIALEAVAGSDAAAACAPADDPLTSTAVQVERAVLEALGGGCLLPLGVLAEARGGQFVVTAALASPGGIRRVELAGAPNEGRRLGEEIARQLGLNR